MLVLYGKFFLKSYHGKTGFDVRKYLQFCNEGAEHNRRNVIRDNFLKIPKTKHAA